jgi:hypothetical protein
VGNRPEEVGVSLDGVKHRVVEGHQL